MYSVLHNRFRVVLLVSLLLGATAGLQVVAADKPATVPLDIKSQPLGDALNEFARQTGLQVVLFANVGTGITTPKLSGAYVPQDALQMLLAHTGLRFEFVNPRTIAVREAARETKSETTQSSGVVSQPITLAQSNPPGQMTQAQKVEAQDPARATEEVESDKGTPEMLVKGRRTVNADIERTEDDTQPYVVFNQEQIRNAMANNIEDLLKTRLPMNTVQGTNALNSSLPIFGNQSSINLRGLGTNQTVILVDGRRMAGVNTGGGFGQADVNGIPLSSIERIEVLPSTASGIYGGGATGGVVNIITRQDYAGIDLNLTYNNTFDSDMASRRIEGSGGFSFWGGTRLMISASHSDANPLMTGERDFAARGRALQLANDPASFYQAAGAVPFGYTGNIRRANGVPLQLKPQYGGQILSSPRTFIPVGYRGLALDGVGPLVANVGQFNLNVPDDLNGNTRGLMNNPTVQAATLNLRREFGPRVEAFVDLNWQDNEGRTHFASATSQITLLAAAPNNPFTSNVVVRLPIPNITLPLDSDSETRRATGGLIVRLPGDWTLSGDYVWSESHLLVNAALGFLTTPGVTALGNGTLDLMRDVNMFPIDYSAYRSANPSYVFGPSEIEMKQGSLRLSGSVWHLPAGPIMVSSLVEKRKELAKDNVEDSIIGPPPGDSFPFIYPSSWQDVDAYYAEVRVPLFSARNGRRFLQALEFQASVRYDDYATTAASPAFYDAFDPPVDGITYSTNRFNRFSHTFGLRYSPSEDLTLRASAGTGFLPPGIENVTATPLDTANITIVDPKRSGALETIGPIPILLGGNPGLQPEESDSWSVGAVFTPRFLPDLRFSLDYTRIKKSDEIFEPLQQLLFDLEDVLPGRIMRAPLTGPDAALGYTGGVVQSLDSRALNMANARLEAYDFQVDYVWRGVGAGDLRLATVLTWQPHFERQATLDDVFVDSVGFSSGQLELRGNTGLTWEGGPWTLGWSMQYYDHYRVYTATAVTIASLVRGQGSAFISDQSYHDLFGRYRFGETGGFLGQMLADAEISFGIQNVFDKSPPILATGALTAGVGGYSTYGDPRMRRYSISLRKRF